jgi:hypothetical protein
MIASRCRSEGAMQDLCRIAHMAGWERQDRVKPLFHIGFKESHGEGKVKRRPLRQIS